MLKKQCLLVATNLRKHDLYARANARNVIATIKWLLGKYGKNTYKNNDTTASYSLKLTTRGWSS